MKKIVVAADSFKGSVSSLEVAGAAELAILKNFPDCRILKIPMADGGEGTVDALITALAGTKISCMVKGPLGEPVNAVYGLLADEKTAVIEMASACGLTLVPQSDRNPLRSSTYGLGELIKDALARGCQNFLIGIGGSATNDGGTGMLQALGFKFLDKEGQALPLGGQILGAIQAIDHSKAIPEFLAATFTIACDVDNPCTGPRGAAHVYARQKGADDQAIHTLEEGMKNFVEVVKLTKGIDVNQIAGSGAAGGLGGGFLAFANAELKPGAQMILDALNFQNTIEDADLVITGEGKLDQQTSMGKAPVTILKAAQQRNIPVIAIGGCTEDVQLLNDLGFLAVLPITPYPVSMQRAMEKEFTIANITRTLDQLFRLLKNFKTTGA
ncbi:glycerate kinase family protein [Pedobacter sp. SAFR-022]|uniref:glycerate kinase family protein n=1 Tax=Pedobacter sp. SAFR-022 TaxID=3436861 RepID=UPI003F7D4520